MGVPQYEPTRERNLKHSSSSFHIIRRRPSLIEKLNNRKHNIRQLNTIYKVYFPLKLLRGFFFF